MMKIFVFLYCQFPFSVALWQWSQSHRVWEWRVGNLSWRSSLPSEKIVNHRQTLESWVGNPVIATINFSSMNCISLFFSLTQLLLCSRWSIFSQIWVKSLIFLYWRFFFCRAQKLMTQFWRALHFLPWLSNLILTTTSLVYCIISSDDMLHMGKKVIHHSWLYMQSSSVVQLFHF